MGQISGMRAAPHGGSLASASRRGEPNNEKIRDVIDTVGKKGVLLLGRFTEGRIEVLERPCQTKSGPISPASVGATKRNSK
jgi:hypothetical protein